MTGANKRVNHDATVSRLRGLVADSGADALVLTSPENVFFASGVLITTQRSIPDRLEFVVVTAGGDVHFLVCNIEESLARTSPIQNVSAWIEFQDRPLTKLVELLRELGVNPKQLLVELTHLTAGSVQELRQVLPNVKLVDVTHQMALIRMIKSPAEVEWIGAVHKHTAVAIEEAFEEMRLGQTDYDLASGIAKRMMSAGAHSIEFMVIGVGKRSSHIAHAMPANSPLLAGDHIRVDVGGLWDGYYSDIARCAFSTPVADELIGPYQKLVELQNLTIEFMKPGINVSEVFQYCVTKAKQLGLDFSMPHIGHSVGIGLHEFPLVSPRHDQQLMPDMVFNIEPFVSVPGFGALHIEDTVAITETGSVVLSRRSDLADPVIISR